MIWYLVTSDSEIYPLTIYSKNDQEDICIKEIKRIIDRILEDDEIYLYGDLVPETDSNHFPEGSELAMTLADQWREEGLQKGIEKGIEKGIKIGKEEALAEVAANQLTERFGKLPMDIKEAIMKADSIALGLLLSNIFRYEDVEDVWKYIR
ncbi:hypothetical protein [Sporosarcina obsidiansis]|uniref:hypothetical protein n=1 Tax=Sporosarcina obsidiansis TaxID=2660748 RepID=UPI00129BA14F|nr:hypothetical protein [Sporosarcina obsidiansis]